MTDAQRRQAGGPSAGDSAVAEDAVQYLDGLYATAMRLTRDPSAADDLVQDTYVKALRFAHRFERGTNLRAWLFTILHNTFRNERRDANRDPVDVDSVTVDLAADVRPASESPEDLVLRGALGTDLQAALEALPESYRQCVWLRDVEEFTYAEIAGILDVPVGTVMSRISRGRRLLYQHLTKGPGKAPGRGGGSHAGGPRAKDGAAREAATD
jgi:RNA polymerase sigma-70 factor (ECF subfamily)